MNLSMPRDESDEEQKRSATKQQIDFHQGDEGHET
jgi:hypothetical protein